MTKTHFEKTADKSELEKPVTQAQADTKKKAAVKAASKAKKAMKEFGADSKQATEAVDAYSKADAVATAVAKRVRKPVPKRKIAGEVVTPPPAKSAKKKRNISKMSPAEIGAHVIEEIEKNGPLGTKFESMDASERDPMAEEAAAALPPPPPKAAPTRAELRVMSAEDRRQQAEAARTRPLRPRLRGLPGRENKAYNRMIQTFNAAAVISQCRRDIGDQIRALKR